VVYIIHPDITEEQYYMFGKIAEELVSQTTVGKQINAEIEKMQQ